MKRRHLIFAFLFIFFNSSCNLAASTPTAAVISQPTLDIPITGVSTPTPVQVETLIPVVELPTATHTSTPSLVLASPREQPVNCRFGPDISYAVVGALIVGRQAEVIGKNADVTWVFVRNPSDPSTSCWLSMDFVTVQGNLDMIPALGPPEIMVTEIQVRIEPVAMNVACDALPQSVFLSADITTNGPSIVTWVWETSTGRTSDQKQVLFEAGGTKTVLDYIQVDQVGDYSIRVQSILPNSQAGDATFKVVCTP